MDKKLYVCNFLVFIIISTLLTFIWGTTSQNIAFYGDDLNFALSYNHSNILGTIFGEESNFHGGKYIGLLLMRFLMFSLPTALNIHISTFAAHILPYINGFFAIWIFASIIYPLCFLFQKDLSEKSNLSNFCFAHLLFLLLIINVFYAILYIPISQIFYCNYAFYRYALSLFFFSFIIFYFLKIFLCKKIYKIETILMCLCCYIVTTSIELLPIICACLIILTNLLNNRVFRQKINPVRTFLPLLIIGITCCLLINPESIQIICYERGININSFLQNDWFAIIKEFISFFIHFYILKFLWIWIIIFLLFCIKVQSEDMKKIKIYNLIYIISVLTAFFSLILCGKTFGISNLLYINHFNVKFLFYILLLYPLNYLLISFFNYKSLLDKFNKISFYTVIIIYLIVSVYNLKLSTTVTNFTEYNKKILKDIYIAEKIMRYYHIKNQTPILPSYKDRINEYDMLPEGTYYKDLLSNDYENKCFDNGIFMKIYYISVYPDTPLEKQSYCISKDAESIYRKNGGILTEEELEELDFEKLKNDNFILGK